MTKNLRAREQTLHVMFGRTRTDQESMKRTKVLLTALALLAGTGCDTTTGPWDFTLDDLPAPPRDVATVAVTEDLSLHGRTVVEARELYFFALRTPPPLPELLYDAALGGGATFLRIVLPGTRETGTFSTGEEGVAFSFGAPNGSVFEPRGTCRINVTTALGDGGAGRLRGHADCPVTDDSTDMRVLVKFDYSND